MKKTTYIIIFIVIVLHLVLLSFLFMSPKDNKDGGQTNSKQEPQELVPEAPPVVTPVPEITPAAQDLPGTNVMVPEPEPPKMTWPVTTPYSPAYFTKDIKQLPAKLATASANCDAGIAVDLSTNRILWAKNESSKHTIASITKMITTMLAVKKIYDSNGAISLETPIKVTVESSKQGGSQVWLDPKETFTFQELLKCALVHSANDAAYLLAQYCGDGSATTFVQQMNSYMKSLGCTSFRFINPNGLPDKANKNDENSANAIELAYLAGQLLKIPEIMAWTGVRLAYTRENDEAYLKRNNGKPTMLNSSNPLLGKCTGVNGMKTGYTDKSRFCLVATCERGGKETCIVLLGCKDKQTRNTLAFGLVDWLYQQN